MTGTTQRTHDFNKKYPAILKNRSIKIIICIWNLISKEFVCICFFTQTYRYQTVYRKMQLLGSSESILNSSRNTSETILRTLPL
jgi:hypothetical protein